jgi:MFS family permease
VLDEADARRETNRLRAIVAVTALCDFVFGATNVFVMLHAGIPAVSIGTAMAATVLVTRVVEAPTGALADRFGYRGVAFAGLALWGAGLILFGTASGTAGFVLALLVWSAGMATYSGAPTALVVNRLRGMGAQDLVARTLRSAQISRWVAASAGAGIVAAGGHWLSAQAMITAAGAVLLAVAVWMRAGWPVIRPVRSATAAARFRAGLREIRRPQCAQLLWLSCVAAAAMSLLIMAWQPITVQYVDFSVPALGIALLFMTLGSALGAWAARTPRGADAEPYAAAAAAALLLALELVGHGRVATAAGLVIAEFMIGMTGVFLSIRSHKVIPDDLRNTMSSLFSTASGVSMGVADLAFGHLWHAYGPAGGLHVGERFLLGLLGAYGVVKAVRLLRVGQGCTAREPLPTDGIRKE